MIDVSDNIVFHFFNNGVGFYESNEFAFFIIVRELGYSIYVLIVNFIII